MSDLTERLLKAHEELARQSDEIERLTATLARVEPCMKELQSDCIYYSNRCTELEAVYDAAGEYLYDSSKRDGLQEAYLAAVQEVREPNPGEIDAHFDEQHKAALQDELAELAADKK